jgi:hypothetical protein
LAAATVGVSAGGDAEVDHAGLPPLTLEQVWAALGQAGFLYGVVEQPKHAVVLILIALVILAIRYGN